MDARLAKSLSGVIATDCTKNLSLHFVPGGGSCFKACRMTTGRQAWTAWRGAGCITLYFNLPVGFDAA